MEVEPILPGEATLGENRVRAGAVIVVEEDAPPLLDVDVVATHLAAALPHSSSETALTSPSLTAKIARSTSTNSGYCEQRASM